MGSDTPVKDVSDTSYWVAYYRAKESQRKGALFNDPFAKALAGERGERIAKSMGKISKYTEWSVISRTVIIDRFIEAAIKEGVDAIINLGAGLDARPYRMNLPESFEWIEVDYPQIIAYKSQALSAETPKCKLSRVVVDLADSEKRREFFREVAPQAKKVLILTEGVIPYLSPEQVSELATDLLQQPRFSYWITEYFHFSVYRYLRQTVRMAKMRNAPFRFYPDDWFAYFKNLGWVAKETRYTGEIAREFKRRPPMPWFAHVMFVFLPAYVKEQAGRMTGFVVFQRAQ